MSAVVSPRVHRTPIRPPRPAVAAVVTGSAAAVLAAGGSQVPSYWADEIASVQAARLTPVALWGFIQHKDGVHALYDALLHVWVLVAGDSPFATRLLSALAVGLAAAGVVAVGAVCGRLKVGVWAGVIFALLPRTTFMGAEARSYALATAIVVWGVVALVVASRRRTTWWWALYAALVAVGAYLFLDTLLMCLVHLVFVVAERRGMLRRWLLAVAGAVVATAPLLALASRQRAQIAWISAEGAVTPWMLFVEPWFESSLPAAVLALVLLVMATARWRTIVARTGTSLVILGLAWAFVPSAALWAADAMAGPLYLARYLSFAAPGMALLLAVAITGLPWHRSGLAAAAVLAIVCAPTYLAQRTPYAKGGGSDLAQLAGYIHDHASPGDAVFLANDGPFTLRPRLAIDGYPGSFRGLDDVAFVRSGMSTGVFTDVTRAPGDIDWTDVRTVWVATDIADDDEGIARTLTQAGFAPDAPHALHRTTVTEYSRRPR
ncbi:hypothetical protein ET475_16995 [Microbacterium protaetiae]|uniref:Glycosyltransferase RgtA/B/C/D-like domain-containing protein n=1 Tax=Microbacterium protaetiae TaxID=2509458 RepID=A0A4P6EGC6_9MICO|nr:hypothetical protein [Microbacterium protaetiae]QAY61490.1 hypothetical protein ET475_16995 [Microbacterium protaetiae]